MTREINLTFTDKIIIDNLLADTAFMLDSKYLTPHRLDEKNIRFSDTVPQHTLHDTEDIVLSKCAMAIKRMFFGNKTENIEYLNPYPNQFKGGITFKGNTLVISTAKMN